MCRFLNNHREKSQFCEPTGHDFASQPLYLDVFLMQFRWNRHEIERSAGRPGQEMCEKPVPVTGRPALNRALCQPTSLFSKPYRAVEVEPRGWLARAYGTLQSK